MERKPNFDIKDAGVGFELTESQFDQLGRKHSDLLTIHANGNTKVITQSEPNFDMEEIV